MATGRRNPERREPLFVSADGILRCGGHPFYARLTQLLAEHGFDDFVEVACAPYLCGPAYPWRAFVEKHNAEERGGRVHADSVGESAAAERLTLLPRRTRPRYPDEL